MADEDEVTDRRGLFRNLLGGVGKAVGSGSVFDSLESTAPPESAEEDATQASPDRSPLGTRTATTEEVLASAREAGLKSRDDSLREVVRASICIQPGLPRWAAGVTVGGHPRLPRGTDWPEWEDNRLDFIAQVDLAAFAGTAPQMGGADRLLFFFDVDNQPSGFETGHLGSGAVLTLPSDGSSEWVFEGTTPEVAVETLMPRAGSEAAESLDLSDAERHGWEQTRIHLSEEQGTELTDGLPSDHVVHRIFGYPDEAGGDMPLICELAASGYDVPGNPFSHPEASRLRGAARRWEMVAQFSADSEFEWSWGEPGKRLYFWCDHDALRAGDLSQVRAIVR